MTVELGQMATEYLDDRKNEFYTLERIIKQSRNERIHSLRTVERSIHLQRANIKNLIRKEVCILGFSLSRFGFFFLNI